MRKIDVITKNASIVARRYKKRCWWSSEEDVRQEAIVAQLDSLRNFDPQRAKLVQYTWASALYAARRAVLKSSSPVSCSSNPDKLVGYYRQDFPGDHTTADKDGFVHDTPSECQQQPTQEERLTEARRQLLIRQRLATLIGEESVEFAIDLVTKEFTPADVSAEHGISVAVVYRAMRTIRGALSSDRVLYELWRDNG